MARCGQGCHARFSRGSLMPMIGRGHGHRPNQRVPSVVSSSSHIGRSVREASLMERRTALVSAIATGVSLTVGVVAFAAIGGASILGLGGGGSGAPSAGAPMVVHQVQTIEDQVVVSSHSTDVPRDSARAPLVPAAGETSASVPAADGVTVVIGGSPTGSRSAGVSAGSQSNTAPPSAAEIPSVSVTATTSTPSSVQLVAPSSSAPATAPPSSSATPAATPGTAATPTTAAATPATAVSTTAPASAAPASAAPATTAARPPGVPADWPADQPVPPVPADCLKPQLEDNGVWNCER